MKLTLTILSASALVSYGADYVVDTMATGFSLPTDAVVDSGGNVYVANYGANRINKVTPDGTVTVFAGSGSVGSADGTGAAASFSNPVGVAVDSAGNVYVSDRGNRLIRKITPGAVVTTLAGIAGVQGGADGPGASATFKYTHGISVHNASGNIFVADREGCTVRLLTPSGGGSYTVSTIGGSFGINSYVDATNNASTNGSRFSFDSPRGVPVDSAGDVYVIDGGAAAIRKITHIGTDWVTTTISGHNGRGSDDGLGNAAKYNTPYNGSFDAAGNLYVADTGTGTAYGQTIRKLSPVGGSDWFTTTIIGQAGFIGADDGAPLSVTFGHDSPFGVSSDPLGNLYITDYGNQSIRRALLPPVLKITSIAFVSGNVQIDFTSDPADTAGQFTLQSSGLVGGTYNDVAPAATITQLGAGSFRAVEAPNGGTQFYRIKK